MDADGFDDASCGGTDCDDSDAAISPSAVDICDGVDNDCSGSVDPGDTCGCTSTDVDMDGVCDNIDPDPANPDGSFDTLAGTEGQVTDTGGNIVEVVDTGSGVLVTVMGGVSPATIEACPVGTSSLYPSGLTVIIPVGGSALVFCGSLDIHAIDADITVDLCGGNSVVVFDGSRAFIEPDAPAVGDVTVTNEGSGPLDLTDVDNLPTFNLPPDDTHVFTIGTCNPVVLCHLSPGQGRNAHTITVGAPAVDAHLGHGDTKGRCVAEDNDLPGRGRR